MQPIPRLPNTVHCLEVCACRICVGLGAEMRLSVTRSEIMSKTWFGQPHPSKGLAGGRENDPKVNELDNLSAADDVRLSSYSFSTHREAAHTRTGGRLAMQHLQMRKAWRALYMRMSCWSTFQLTLPGATLLARRGPLHQHLCFVLHLCFGYVFSCLTWEHGNHAYTACPADPLSLVIRRQPHWLDVTVRNHRLWTSTAC